MWLFLEASAGFGKVYFQGEKGGKCYCFKTIAPSNPFGSAMTVMCGSDSMEVLSVLCTSRHQERAINKGTYMDVWMYESNHDQFT